MPLFCVPYPTILTYLSPNKSKNQEVGVKRVQVYPNGKLQAGWMQYHQDHSKWEACDETNGSIIIGPDYDADPQSCGVPPFTMRIQKEAPTFGGPKPGEAPTFDESAQFDFARKHLSAVAMCGAMAGATDCVQRTASDRTKVWNATW